MTSIRTPEQRRDWWAFLLREANRPDLAHEAAQGRFDPEPRAGAGK